MKSWEVRVQPESRSDWIAGSFELYVEGVYTLPKAAGAIAQGAKIYWSPANGNVTTSASGNKLIGHATGAYADSHADMDVRLSN